MADLRLDLNPKFGGPKLGNDQNHLEVITVPASEDRLPTIESRDLDSFVGSCCQETPKTGIFIGFVFLEVFINYDSGAIPALLSIIAPAFEINNFEKGLLGGLPYMGLVLMSVIAGRLLASPEKFPQKMLIIGTLLGNVLCCSSVGFMTNKYALFAARLGTGLTQATFVIFVPLWVDKFAPRSSLTTWMAVIQASIAIGVIVGYGAGACVAEVPDHWQIIFLIQGGILLCLVFALGFLKRTWIEVSTVNLSPHLRQGKPSVAPRTIYGAGAANTTLVSSFCSVSHVPDDHGTRQPIMSHEGRASFRASVMTLLKNKVFVGCSLALCGLFFVVTGIQFWSTKYLESLYSTSHMEIKNFGNMTANFHPEVLGSYTRIYSRNYNDAYIYYKADKSDDAILYYESYRWRIATADTAWKTKLPIRQGLANITAVEGQGSLARPDKAKWTEGYLVEPALDQRLIFICFAIVAATGPTVGVIVGGTYIDRIGGYKGHDNLVRCLKVCMVWGGIATAIGLVACFVDMFWVILVCFWSLLFFGGCVVAPATGILIAIVEPSFRPIANAMSMVCYNVFGYSLGSILPGILMDFIDPCVGEGPSSCDPSSDPSIVERWGMRLILGWAIFGFGGMYFAWSVARSDPCMGDNLQD